MKVEYIHALGYYEVTKRNEEILCVWMKNVSKVHLGFYVANHVNKEILVKKDKGFRIKTF